MSVSCPFCARIAEGEVDRESTRSASFADGFPVTDGHALVVPKRHVGSALELPGRDFNIGLNDGVAAGQTVDHAHVHVIPRRPGDVDDPRGGVRWVVPERAAYWKDA